MSESRTGMVVRVAGGHEALRVAESNQNLTRDRRRTRCIICILLWCALSVLVTRRYILSAEIIEGSSMAPTFVDGDRCLLNRFCLLFRDPTRGNIVVVEDGLPGYAVKRVIGLPGETLELREGVVFVDGTPLKEPYLGKQNQTFSRRSDPVHLGPGEYFIMGDNRLSSYDSRAYGPLHKRAIKGVVASTY